MTPDELITNASPEQLREALRVIVDMEHKSGLEPAVWSYNFALDEVQLAITNALKGEVMNREMDCGCQGCFDALEGKE